MRRLFHFLCVVLWGGGMTPAGANTPHSLPTPPSLAGVWSVSYHATTEWTLPVLGKTRQQIRVVGEWSIEQKNAREVVVKEHLCSLEFHHSSPLLRFTFHEGLLPHLSGERFVGQIRAGDDGWFFKTDPQTRHAGYAAEENDSRPLSTIPEEEWRDADGDGRPGLSIHLRGVVNGVLTALQRDTIQFEGKWTEEPPSIEGVVDWKWERRLLSSSTPKIQELPQEEWVPVLQARAFRLTPLSPGATRCVPETPSP